MSAVAFPPLVCTGNFVNDLARFIWQKNVVVLHTTDACRVFHTIDFREPESVEALKDVRVIYLDCNSLEALLNDVELKSYFTHIEGITELGSESILRNAIIEQHAVPNKIYTRFA